MPASPTYRRIADLLRDRIAGGELAPGERVPSARRIASEYGVALATATRVLAALRADGLVRAVQGVGTVVVDREGSRPVEPPEPRAARKPGRPEPRAARWADARDRGVQELSTEQVVRTAVRVADEDGMVGLSMRRIAAELGVATMSLYPRVRSKDELLVLMLDAVFARHPPPAAVLAPAGTGMGWRRRVELIARLQWTVYNRHSWVPGVVSMTRPQQAPHGMLHTEALVRAFDGLGLDPTAQLHAAVTLAGFVRSSAIGLEAERLAEQDTGLTADQWMQAAQPAFEAVAATWPLPALARVAANPGVELDLTSLFEFGLARLLDGYAAWLAGRSK